MTERLSQEFTTLAAAASHEDIVKRSRFLARAVRLDDPEAAPGERGALSASDANHNVWAWRVGLACRCSDDGEPTGTAGRPVLGAIDGQGLDHVLVVVTRWFGGVKLGAGGLVRAYGGAASACLRAAPRLELRPKVTLRVATPFPRVSALIALCDGFGAERREERYTEAGWEAVITLDAARQDELRRAVRDATRGETSLSAFSPPSGDHTG